jgi:sarcosine oxidase, subunit delta
MKLLRCPLNGERNISEFICGGVVRTAPDPSAASDAEWADHLFLNDNIAGPVREWWFHVPSGYWFIAERDTLTDEILRTYPPDQLAGSANRIGKA